MFSFKFHFIVVLYLVAFSVWDAHAQVVVLQSDFGTRDGAVAAMKLVILGVDPRLQILDNTHEIEPFQIYEGAYRLFQTAPIARPGTVYVSVVDPGVGSNRLSIVAKDKNGVLYVTQDNGTLTFVDKEIGIAEVRVIDESKLRRPGSEQSHTFHGRDIYAYVAGLLASGQLAFGDVGLPFEPSRIKRIYIPEAKISHDRLVLSGIIEIHDVRFGNLWSNIPESVARDFGLKEGSVYQVRILREGQIQNEFSLPFLRTFASAQGRADSRLLYLNSLGRLSCAKALGNFAAEHGIGSGPQWSIEILK